MSENLVLDRLPEDCRLAAKCLEETGTFEIGQSLFCEAADEITRLRAALADAQAVGFAAGVEAAAKRVGFTECPACGGEGWEIYDHEEHDCQTCFGRGVVPHLDKSALTPPDATAAAARVLLGVWPNDASFDAAFNACAASYHGGDQMQDVMDRTLATVSAALRAIAGDTP